LTSFKKAYSDSVSESHNFENGFTSRLQLLLRKHTEDFFAQKEGVKNSHQVGGASGVRFDGIDQIFGSPEKIQTFDHLHSYSFKL